MFSNDATRSALVLKQAWRQQLAAQATNCAPTRDSLDGGGEGRRDVAGEGGGSGRGQGRELGLVSQDGKRGRGGWGRGEARRDGAGRNNARRVGTTGRGRGEGGAGRSLL